MSAWAHLFVGGKQVYRWRDEVPMTYLFLFTRYDLHVIDRSQPIQSSEPPDTSIPVLRDDLEVDWPVVQLTATARILNDRLDAFGIAEADMPGCLDEAIATEIDLLESISAQSQAGEVRDDLARAIGDLRSMTWKSWTAATAAAMGTAPTGRAAWRDYTTLGGLLDLWERFDPRWTMRAVLSVCDPDYEVVIDISDLDFLEFLDDLNLDRDPQRAANLMFNVQGVNDTPAVIITEGTTDTEFLQDAIRIRKPHLTSFVRFLDYQYNPQGGAGAAVAMVKAFAAAGISNRTVVLLDNDAAAREAIRGLKTPLPSHYVVATYPDLPLATHYPTVGPTGLQHGDLNGTAASIEMYLGQDALTDANNELRPVRWGPYLHAVQAYQGELTDKSAIQTKFRRKVEAARQDPSIISTQDWSGMDLVLASLLKLLAGLAVRDPGT